MATIKQQTAYIELCRRLFTRAREFNRITRSERQACAERVLRRILARHPQKFGGIQ